MLNTEDWEFGWKNNGGRQTSDKINNESANPVPCFSCDELWVKKGKSARLAKVPDYYLVVFTISLLSALYCSDTSSLLY